MLRAGGGGGGVTSFNSRTGAVTQTSGDITTALGFTPLNPANNLNDVNSAATALANLGGVSVLRSYIAGLTLSNDGVTPNTKLDVAAGQCADDSNAAMLSLSAGTIDCTTTGANGLDTGSLANNTWYHAFAIAKAAGASPAFLASTSASAPTMPATYTLKRRIGSILTDGSAHILAFTQIGDAFYWSAVVTDLSNYQLATNPGELKTFTVPTGVAVRPIIRWGTSNGSLHAQIQSPNETAVAVPAAVTTAPGTDLDGSTFPTLSGSLALYTNTSAQLRLVGSATSSGVYAFTRGWIDDRGRYN